MLIVTLFLTQPFAAPEDGAGAAKDAGDEKVKTA